MTFAGKALLAVLWLIIVPMFAGALFFRRKERPSGLDCFLAGYLFLFSLSELLILPMIYFGLPLHILVICYGMLTGAAALAGAVRLLRTKKPGRPHGIAFLRGSSPFFFAAVAVIIFQIVVVALLAHFDADDALYVATGTTAVETDSIFRYDAYTGAAYQLLPRRYILSPFPIFLAVISQLCGGLHPAITAHTVFPPVFLICVYSVAYRLARKWFDKDRNAQGIFLFLTAMLSWFSAYSVYNTGNFQMVRLWQGKAVLAAFMLPLIFYLSLSIILEERPAYSWILLFMANLGSCLLTSMGIILAPLMISVFVLLGLFRFRSLKRTALGLACCLPSIVLGIVYIMF